MTKTPCESAALAINSGCDLNCGNTYLHILKACQMGLVTEETVTRAAVRLFTTRYLLGLFDGSEYDRIPYQEVESPEHLKLAEQAAQENFVLLKNNGILPLEKKKLKTVGIIGPNADSREALIGNYHGTASRYVTFQEGIEDYLGEEVRVLTSKGCDLFRDRTESLACAQDRLTEARIVAENSDVVLLCLGLDETLEGEEGDTGNSYASGDKQDLLLPSVQRELMEALAECRKPVILCLMAGSDLDLSFAAEHFDAVLLLWYPGCRGGSAAAKILFGEASPSGKLPVTFYNSLEELPEFTDYSMRGRTYRYMEKKAQFPFGYGLTYGHVEVDSAEIVTDGEMGEVQILGEAKNSGERTTQEVVQVYVRDLDSPDATLHPHLEAFARVTVPAQGSASFCLSLRPEAFTVVGEDGIRREGSGHEFEVYVGCSQPDERSAELTGSRPVRLVYRR